MYYSFPQECERFLLRDFTSTRAVGTTLMVNVVWRHILAKSCVYIFLKHIMPMVTRK